MQGIFLFIIAVGSFTGFGVSISAVLFVAYDLYKHFTWNEVRLSEKEQELWEKAMADDRSEVDKFLDKYSKSRGFVWKSYRYNKVTKKLRIR